MLRTEPGEYWKQPFCIEQEGYVHGNLVFNKKEI
jgi:hypothetical protein